MYNYYFFFFVCKKYKSFELILDKYRYEDNLCKNKKSMMHFIIAPQGWIWAWFGKSTHRILKIRYCGG